MTREDLSEAEKALYPPGLIDAYRRQYVWPPRCGCGALAAFTEIEKARCLCLACLRQSRDLQALLGSEDGLATARAKVEGDPAFADSILPLAYPEVEIATASTDLTTGTYVTISARRTSSGWRFRVFDSNVDDEIPDYFADRQELPSVTETIEMIDEVCSGPEGLYMARQWAFDSGDEPEEAACLVSVDSSLHPGVAAHFEHEANVLAERWTQERRREEGEDDESEE